MKELAYGASHEINNPLANIAARAQTLLKREADADKRKMLEAIHRQAMRAHEMISDLMLFARPPKLQPSVFDIGEMLSGLVGELEGRAAEASVTIALAVDGQPLVNADRVQAEVAVKAVLENSLDAMGAGGQIAVSAYAEPPGMVAVTIRDNGPGIPAEVREHLFDPFFSGREAGRGLGFGLSKCWRIVTDHGGRVEALADSAPGACFKITLPAGAV
ncbi:MAG: HAMP domain-containing sensor histidine kinase [Planctomycetota bacterium]